MDFSKLLEERRSIRDYAIGVEITEEDNETHIELIRGHKRK